MLNTDRTLLNTVSTNTGKLRIDGPKSFIERIEALKTMKGAGAKKSLQSIQRRLHSYIAISEEYRNYIRQLRKKNPKLESNPVPSYRTLKKIFAGFPKIVLEIARAHEVDAELMDLVINSDLNDCLAPTLDLTSEKPLVIRSGLEELDCVRDLMSKLAADRRSGKLDIKPGD